MCVLDYLSASSRLLVISWSQSQPTHVGSDPLDLNQLVMRLHVKSVRCAVQQLCALQHKSGTVCKEGSAVSDGMYDCALRLTPLGG